MLHSEFPFGTSTNLLYWTLSLQVEPMCAQYPKLPTTIGCPKPLAPESQFIQTKTGHQNLPNSIPQFLLKSTDSGVFFLSKPKQPKASTASWGSQHVLSHPQMLRPQTLDAHPARQPAAPQKRPWPRNRRLLGGAWLKLQKLGMLLGKTKGNKRTIKNCFNPIQDHSKSKHFLPTIIKPIQSKKHKKTTPNSKINTQTLPRSASPRTQLGSGTSSAVSATR